MSTSTALSPTVAELLQVLQQEARSAARIEAMASDQIHLETPHGLRHFYRDSWGHRVLTSSQANGFEVLHLQTPTCATSEHPHVRPGVWYGHETRLDALGREWTRNFGDMVMDDFGTLVEVPQ